MIGGCVSGWRYRFDLGFEAIFAEPLFVSLRLSSWWCNSLVRFERGFVRGPVRACETIEVASTSWLRRLCEEQNSLLQKVWSTVLQYWLEDCPNWLSNPLLSSWSSLYPAITPIIWHCCWASQLWHSGLKLLIFFICVKSNRKLHKNCWFDEKKFTEICQLKIKNL